MTSTPGTPAAPSAVVCPRCGRGWFVAGSPGAAWLTCSSCGHQAARVFVGEFAYLEVYLAGAHARHDWLAQRIAAGDPGPGLPVGSAAPGSAGAGTQNLLLGLGALLLSLAGILFAAVAWSFLGPAARLVLLAVVGAALAAGGNWVKTKVRAAAESLTLVGAALMAVAAYAAPALGAVGAGWSSQNKLLWHAGASVVLTLVYLFGLRISRMRAWVFSAGATGCAAVLLAALHVANQSRDPLWFTAVTALAGTGLAVAPALVRRTSAGAGIRRWVSAALLDPVRSVWAASTLLLLACAAMSTGLWLTERDRVGAYAVALVLLGGVAALVHAVDPRRVSRDLAEVSAGVFGGAAVALPLAGGSWVTGPSLPVLVLAAVLLVSASVTRRVRATVALPAAAVLAVGAMVLPVTVGASYPRAAIVGYLATAAAALLAAALLGRVTLNPPTRTAWEVLAWPAAGFAALAWFIYWDGGRTRGEHRLLETYTVPAAVALLVAGAAWSYRRRRDTGAPVRSVPTLLPGLLALVLPSGFLALDISYGPASSVALIRSVVLLGGGVAVIAAGARLRVAAFVLAGTVAAGFATIGHLIAFSDLLPRWVSLAASGLLLLAVGARWEWLRSRQTEAENWVGALR